MRVQFQGTGIHLPPTVQTAEELAVQLGRPASWIADRVGVPERRISHRPMDEMAAEAARQALGDGPPPDLLVNASLTPLQLIPDSSVFIAQQLGLSGVPSFSIHATCLSFFVGIQVVSSLIHAGAYRRVLLVSAEQGSVCRDFEHPESAALIGDGAAAAVLTPTPDGQASRLVAYDFTTWPEGADLTELRGCGTRRHPNDPSTVPADNLFRMNGPGIYKMAVRRVARAIGRVLGQAGLKESDIDLVVPHQTSGPGVDIIERFGFPPSKIVKTIHRYGNSIAASLPMALHTAAAEGRLRRGDRLLLLGTGAGLSVGAAVVIW